MTKFKIINDEGVEYFLKQIGDKEEWDRVALVRTDDLKRIFGNSDASDEELEDCAIEYLCWFKYGSIAGRPFAHAPGAKVEGKSKKWVRVVQFGGFDI